MTYNGTHRTRSGILNVRVRMNLVRVVLHARVSDRADICARVDRWVGGWEDRGDWAHDGTYSFRIISDVGSDLQST
jgi:hypothetical protein